MLKKIKRSLFLDGGENTIRKFSSVQKLISYLHGKILN